MTVVVDAQRPARSTSGGRDLQGVWTNGTITPLERPKAFADKPVLTPAEAAEYERTWLDEFRSQFSEEDLMAPDIDYTYMDRMHVVPSRRTSLITDPPNGRLPEQLPAAKARADARPKQSRNDPEVLGLAERCLMETSFDVSTSAPPLVPSPFGQNYYQIVQTPTHVLIFSELIHHARIIRLGGTHPPAHIQLWLGDSIGHWEGDTLVVDTVGLKTITTLDPVGLPHTEQLHVVERIRRTGPKQIENVLTLDDPGAFTRPWSLRLTYALQPPQRKLAEYICENQRNAPVGEHPGFQR